MIVGVEWSFGRKRERERERKRERQKKIGRREKLTPVDIGTAICGSVGRGSSRSVGAGNLVKNGLSFQSAIPPR